MWTYEKMRMNKFMNTFVAFVGNSRVRNLSKWKMALPLIFNIYIRFSINKNEKKVTELCFIMNLPSFYFLSRNKSIQIF